MPDFNADIGEYLRRKRLQDQIAGVGVADDSSEDEALPEESETSTDESEVSPEEAEVPDEDTRPSDPLVGSNSSVEPSAASPDQKTSTIPLPQTGKGPQVQAPKYGPETQSLMDTIHGAPQRSNYQPSTFRKILGTLAGISTGIAYGPKEGAEVGQNTQDAAFNRAQSDYQRNLQNKQLGAGIETGATAAASKMREEEARRQAELARRGAEEARGRRYDWLTGPTSQAYKMEQLKVQHPSVPPRPLIVPPGGKAIDATGKELATNPKEISPTNEFELWHQQNPQAKAEEYPGLSKNVNEYADFRQGYLQKHPGANSTEVVAAYSATHEAPQRAPIISGYSGGRVVGLHPGDTVPSDFQSSQVSNAEKTAAAKQEQGQQAGKDALNYGESYLASGKFTGPGDEALQEKFFELAKPSSGFRMSSPQMNMLMSSRSWMDSAEGLAYHAQTGQWFPPKQRQEIVDTMRALVSSKSGGASPEVQHVVPKVGETFNGSKVKSVKQIK
jgi:hypothetical protein